MCLSGDYEVYRNVTLFSPVGVHVSAENKASMFRAENMQRNEQNVNINLHHVEDVKIQTQQIYGE
jgi:hypothetical protein